MKDNTRAFSKTSNLLLQDFPIDAEGLSELKNNPTLLIDTGYEFVEAGYYEQALKYFSMGISIDNTDPDILNGLGIVLCELNKLEESKRVLERAVRLNPEDPVTLANLAGVYWEIGDLDSAIYYYSQSTKHNTEIEEIYLNLINLYIENDSLFMAYISCLDCLEIFPGNPEAAELLDDILLNLAISFF